MRGLFSWFCLDTAQPLGRGDLDFPALASGKAGGAIMPLFFDMNPAGTLGAFDDHSDPNARLVEWKAGAVCCGPRCC